MDDERTPVSRSSFTSASVFSKKSAKSKFGSDDEAALPPLALAAAFFLGFMIE